MGSAERKARYKAKDAERKARDKAKEEGSRKRKQEHEARRARESAKSRARMEREHPIKDAGGRMTTSEPQAPIHLNPQQAQPTQPTTTSKPSLLGRLAGAGAQIVQPTTSNLGGLASFSGQGVKKDLISAAVAAAGTAAIVATQGAIASATASRETAAIARTANAFGKTEHEVLRMVEKMRLRGEVTKIVKGINVKKLGALTVGLGATIASTDVLFQWYALDNAIGGQKFFLGKVATAVKKGELNPIDGLEAMEKSRELRQIAIDKVKLSNSINPLMWAWRKLILAGVEGDLLDIEFSENIITEAAEQAAADGVKGVLHETESEKWIRVEEERKARREQEIIDEDKRFAEIENNRAKAKADQRAEDEEYWNTIYEENQARAEAARKADQEYWDQVRRKTEENTPSQLNFGLL